MREGNDLRKQLFDFNKTDNNFFQKNLQKEESLPISLDYLKSVSRENLNLINENI